MKSRIWRGLLKKVFLFIQMIYPFADSPTQYSIWLWTAYCSGDDWSKVQSDNSAESSHNCSVWAFEVWFLGNSSVETSEDLCFLHFSWHAGREDILHQFVLPQLQKRAKEKFIQVDLVDLRWGLSQESLKTRSQLEQCLAQIKRCDLFVGILGER